jgi:transposase
MLSLDTNRNYYLFSFPTDMRKSFDGLSGLVLKYYEARLYTGDIFIFINRRRNRIKLLCWQSGGFAIYYKRLEGGTFELPNNRGRDGHIKINRHELILMLEGIELKSIKYRKRYKRRA